MNGRTLLYLIPYLISVLISTGVGLYAWRRRNETGAAPFAIVALSQASWTLGYVFELVSPGLETKIFWDNTQFIGAFVAPLAILAFALGYTGRKLSRPGRTFGLLAIPNIILLLLVFTDDLHGLIRPTAWLIPGEPYDALAYDFTLTVILVTLYNYGLMLTGILMLVTHFTRSHHLYRAQIATIIIGFLIPIVGVALTTAGITLAFHRDTSPLTFAIGNLVVAWGLFHYRLFDVVPVARDKVIESMGDAVMVLDAQNRLVDLNPAAQDLIGQTASEAIGQPAARVFSAWSDLFERYRDAEEARDEIIADAGERQRHFDLRLSPLRDSRGRLTGQLIVVRDITRRKRAEQALQRAHDELEQRVEERTAELARANADLGAEITERKGAEEALRRHTERLKILHEIEQGILTAQSPEAITQAVLSHIRQLIPCQRAGITPFDYATNEAVVLAVDTDTETGFNKGARFRLESFEDELELLRQGQVVMWGEPGSRDRNIQALFATEGLSSVVSVPLITQGELLGCLNLTYETLDPNLFSQEHKAFARQVADQLAIAIQQARLREQVQGHADELEERVVDRTRELRAMYEVMTIASQSADLETTLARSLERVLEAVKSDEGVIHILDPEKSTLRLVVQRGIPSNILPQITSIPAEGLGGWVVEHGEAIFVPDVTSDPRIPVHLLQPRRYVGLPMRAGGQVLGVLGVIRETTQPEFSDEEIALLTSLADRVGAVVESHRLREQAERAAVIEERQRLARDLHDSVTQLLYSLTLLAEAGGRMAQAGDLPQVEKNQARLNEIAQQALQEMRLMVHELRPPVLEQEGLAGALERRLEAVERRAGIEAQLVIEGDVDLPANVQEELYHTAREALNNALKHASASTVMVTLRVKEGQVMLEVRDNGRGFDPETESDKGGLGLVSMQERAERLRGVLHILSAPGEGTRVSVTVSGQGS